MKVILFGASGMIGKGVLLECLDHADVREILSIGRSKMNIEHPKFKQLIHADFQNFSAIETDLHGFDACFFCLGTSAAGKTEEEYTQITYDFTMATAQSLHRINSNMTFIYVSGQGTDSSEKGRMMWARVKGKLENDLLALGFKNAAMFRPGAILPLRGIKSRTKGYQFMYDYFTWLLLLVKAISPNAITDTTKIGLAMINVHLLSAAKKIYHPSDINEIAAK